MRASRNAVAEVSSEGLQTTALPAASAGAILNVSRYSGRFHGEMSTATPTPLARTYDSAPCSSCSLALHEHRVESRQE